PPTLFLSPIVLACATAAVAERRRAGLLRAAVFAGAAGAMGVPWVIHAYRATGLVLPASTHGGKQLWFGSLQVGPYFDNWLDNPRSVLEKAVLDYTSLDDRPLVVSGHLQPCGLSDVEAIELRYWTARDSQPRRIHIAPDSAGAFEFMIDAPPAPASLSYYFVVRASKNGRPVEATTPVRGSEDPLILIVS